ncbi:hypothetical protein PAEPH01_0851 [Pancytospora epiphaga]|nr:hypothetical protein PAEPH01_0851 [Pancytospora epiphaga]
MPVFLLIGSASEYEAQIIKCFENKYNIAVLTGKYPTIRSSLANMENTTLYILPGLGKSERYEIFCLARKNQTRLISLAKSNDDGLSPSDRNSLVMSEFSEMKLIKALEDGTIAPTVANRRSKGVSLHDIGKVKTMINTVNSTYLETNEQLICIIKECEDRFLRMYNYNQTGQVGDLETCYRSMIDAALKRKGFKD